MLRTITARAVDRPAKIQLEAHSGHDSSKYINFVYLQDMHVRDEMSLCFYLPKKDQSLNCVQYEVGYDENGVSLSQLPGRLPPPNHEFGPVKLTIFK